MGRQSPHVQYLLAPPDDQDAAKRLSERYQLHMDAAGAGDGLIEVMGFYFPVFLRDGRQPDGTGLYPTKAMAAEAMGSRDRDCCYVCLGPASMPPHDALQFLRFMRQASLNGWDLADPDYARLQAHKMNRQQRRSR